MIAQPLRVALRADASAQSGLGHVVRSLALGQALRELGIEARLVARDLGVNTATVAHRASVQHALLPRQANDLAVGAPIDQTRDARLTIDCLAAWRPDIVVVDHYGLDVRWHREVCAALDTRIAAIDDLGDRDLLANWVIDHNLSADHAAKYAARVPTSTRLLGGPRFALLAPAYRNAAPRTIAEQARSLGIFMGGTDSGDVTSLVLRACREVALFTGTIEVATTSANPNLGSLRAHCQAWPGTDLLVDAPDLNDFFARHDLHIGAGGGAAWERCCTGAPTLALACAVNQRVVIDPLRVLGVVSSLADGMAVDVVSIGQAVADLLSHPQRRRESSERGQALVDGLGARRVALCLAASTLAVRPATGDDADRMHAWRNDPTTRQASIVDGEINWKSHTRWLTAALADPQRRLLIAHVGPVAVGVIRFDRLTDDRAEVSLYLDPALHGLGLGAKMLHAGEQDIVTRQPAVRELVATVLESNLGSQRLFRAAGYLAAGTHWEKTLPANTGVPTT